jgi:hypothetical protein
MERYSQSQPSPHPSRVHRAGLVDLVAELGEVDDFVHPLASNLAGDSHCHRTEQDVLPSRKTRVETHTSRHKASDIAVDGDGTGGWMG